MCYPFKWPYLDLQEVFTALFCCNEETEKDEIIKPDMQPLHYHIDNQYSAEESEINTWVCLFLFEDK